MNATRGGISCDVLILGAGPGGYAAAIRAGQLGLKTIVVEGEKPGGTCLNVGCIPSKAMIHVAEEFHKATSFATSGKSTLGISHSKPKLDLKQSVSWKDGIVAKLNGGVSGLIKKAGAQLIQGWGKMLDGKTCEVQTKEGTKVIHAEHVVLAPGSVPVELPDLPYGDKVISSTEALALEKVPARLIVVGGGYIALEFAGIFNGLGVDTTVLYRGEEILRGFDDDIRATLHEEMEKQGVKVICGDLIEAIDKGSEGLTIRTKEGRVLVADQVLSAIGRSPYTEGLGLDRVGVELDKTGAIKVDEYSRTNVDHVFAVGDVTNRVNLTPVAIREGAALVETLYNNNPTKIDYKDIPTAVFTQPEIGTVGLTQVQAEQSYDNLDIYMAKFRPMKNTLAGNDEKMLMKIIVDTDSDRVVGCHILGPDSGEMSQLLGIAVKMGATKADFDATMAVHPTAAEELVTMKEPSTRIRK
ncbi:MAG TPA: glutathione-disulfide reductase [Rhizobiales bacterium]|nr:glutathione-disulfide reductase [Hyphomicrobiales bacterium]